MNIFEAISQYAARRICTQWNFGLPVPDTLHTEALKVLDTQKPAVEYQLIDSEEDDKQQERIWDAMDYDLQAEVDREAYEHG